MRDKGKGRKVVDINRQVIRTEDLDEATLAAIMGAKAPPEAEALNHLMDAEPGERSKEAGRRIPPPPTAENDT